MGGGREREKQGRREGGRGGESSSSKENCEELYKYKMNMKPSNK